MIELRTAAMMRSGHHAVINWLFQQMSKNALFINRPNGRLHNLKWVPDEFQHNLTDPDTCLRLFRENKWQPDYFLFNFEDDSPKRITSTAIPKLKNLFPIGEDFHYLIILRDPYNLFASRYKMEETISRKGIKTTSPVGAITNEALSLWKEYAYEFLGCTSKLRNKVCINYNTWCLSPAYRQKIANNIGLEFTDKGIDTVPRFGDGSSFDYHSFNEQAQQMKLMARYKQYEHQEWFTQLFDEEMKSLAQRIFGFNPL